MYDSEQADLVLEMEPRDIIIWVCRQKDERETLGLTLTSETSKLIPQRYISSNKDTPLIMSLPVSRLGTLSFTPPQQLALDHKTSSRLLRYIIP